MPLIKSLQIAARGYRFKAGNSGISRRLKVIKENHPDIENVAVTEETLDNLETGVTTPNKRVEKNPRVAEFKKIERKFFKKATCPNLLTWSEKEQIRFLYNSDPTTWSPNKLSESFPATADIIKKLIKSQWKPMSPQRILNHDNGVKDNWKAVENGHLKLPDFLSAHIKSFVSRKKTIDVPTLDKSLQTFNPSPNKSSEFLNIVKNFTNKPTPSNNPNENECNIVNNKNPTKKGETYVLTQKHALPLKHKYYTLQQLKKELSRDPNNCDEMELKNNDTDNFKESQPKVDPKLLQKPSNVLPPAVYKKSVAKSTVMPEDIDNVPLKIKIPKEKMVKSKTHVYKVNDCYYDSNGEFVYKVPGMV